MELTDHRVWHRLLRGDQTPASGRRTPQHPLKPIKTIPPWAYSGGRCCCPRNEDHLNACWITADRIQACQIVAKERLTIDPVDGHSQLLGETIQIMDKATPKCQFSKVFQSNKVFPPPPFRGLDTIGRALIPAKPDFKNVGIVFSPNFELLSTGNHKVYLDIMGGIGDILFDDAGNTLRVAVSQYVRLASTSIEINSPGSHSLSVTYSGLNFEGQLEPSELREEQLFRNARYVEFILHIHATSGINYIDPTLGSHDYVITHS